ncbi:MAG: DUF2244 domain-containing protein [Boseongicola sp.]|nr:MAG: DUF2244 domain-containing protein [Boseongicola sp.]
MPYRWSDTTAATSVTLWPHQSMTGRGFAWFIGGTAVMLSLPLLAVLGSPVAWVLLIFFVAALAGIWRAIMTNRQQRSLREELTLDSSNLHLTHCPPKGQRIEWQANPHWVTVNLRKDGPVENYLTLSASGREIELGRFLSPDERQSLYHELNEALSR